MKLGVTCWGYHWCTLFVTLLSVIVGTARLLSPDVNPLPPATLFRGECQDVKREPIFGGLKVLIVTTSISELKSGKATGVHFPELSQPYYLWTDMGLDVHIASPLGGEIPIEPWAMSWFTRTEADARYLRDPELQEKVLNTKRIKEIKVRDYEMIYFAGGWGAAFDLGTSEVIAKKVSRAFQLNKILGAVSTGTLGLTRAKKLNREPLLKGVVTTAVTNKQVRQMGASGETLQLPEDVVKKTGARWVAQQGPFDAIETTTAIDRNHRIITGQNQKASCNVAYEMASMLKSKLRGIPQATSGRGKASF